MASTSINQPIPSPATQAAVATPSTPSQKATPASHVTEGLQSTPHSNGSATHFGSAVSAKLTQYKVKPWLLKDLERQKNCNFDYLLKYLLSRCVQDGVTIDKDELFEKSLESVHPICELQTCKDRIREYCGKVENERARYAVFVKAFNFVLDELDKLGDDINTILRPSPSWRSSVVFMRSDPKHIQSAYDGHVYERSPDIALVNVAAALRAYGSLSDSGRLGTVESREASYTLLSHSPPNRLEWPDVMSSWEFKLKKHDIKVPTDPYDVYAMHDKEYNPFSEGLSNSSPEEPSVSTAQTASRPEPSSPTPARRRASSKVQSHSKTEMSGVGSTTSTGSKRKADGDTAKEGPSKKKRTVRYENEKMPPDVQCASYAAERLGCLPCVTHAIELLLQDDVLWLFWFDRHGAIQTTGINFIQDLPRFMVLLLALSRFNKADWGIPDGFPERVLLKPEHAGVRRSNRITPQPEAPVGESDLVFPGIKDEDGQTPLSHTITLQWTGRIYRGYQLVGRATQIYNAFEEGANCRELVAKISFPDKSRVPEPDIIRRARAVDIKDKSSFPLDLHLPDLICAMDIPGWDSGDVREAVGLMTSNEERKRRRVLRVTIYEKLTPLYHLRGNEFRRCWFEIVHCHYLLWGAGIYHNDPSLANVAVRHVNGVPYGVLNDWDLATIEGLSTHDGLERTGTLPFMAVDLCHRDFWEGKIVRLYRHELEGKIWVLPWIFLQHDDDNEYTSHPALERWTENYEAVADAKKGFYSGWDDYTPLDPWKEQWPLAWCLCGMLYDAWTERVYQKKSAPLPTFPKRGVIEVPMEVTYDRFWTAVKECYTLEENLEGYREVRRAVCLPVDA